MRWPPTEWLLRRIGFDTITDDLYEAIIEHLTSVAKETS